MIKTTVSLHYVGVPAAPKKAQKEAMQEGLGAVGAMWHEKMLPVHFTTRAYSLYGAVYKKRGYKYNKRKGHEDPMVFSGVMKRQALASAMITVRASKARVSFHAVRALNLSSRKNYPDMRSELLALAGSELDRFASFLDKRITKNLSEFKAQRTVKAS